ncbi:MAG: hypothetical protein LH480_06355 [Rubrivivax sp.]|nr:hypothetical protein [Rubrivivax sp.]
MPAPPFSSPINRAPVRILGVIGNAIVGGMESWVERLIERLPRQCFEFTA